MEQIAINTERSMEGKETSDNHGTRMDSVSEIIEWPIEENAETWGAETYEDHNEEKDTCIIAAKTIIENGVWITGWF